MSQPSQEIRHDNRENTMRDQRQLREIDWTTEGADLERSCRRQLKRRGIDNRDELADRTQDALALLLVRAGRRPADPVALAIWCCAGDAARGRTVHRETAHGYIDAINPLDARERAEIDRERRESFDRRAALALVDLDV